VRRQADGLALSSRNAYLDAAQRAAAPALHQTLVAAAQRIAAGNAPDEVETWAVRELLAAGFDAVDYVAVRDAETLEPPAPGRPKRLLATARMGTTRLLDNVPVNDDA
jgi:pantoate--beta-alanine ligase